QDSHVVELWRVLDVGLELAENAVDDERGRPSGERPQEIVHPGLPDLLDGRVGGIGDAVRVEHERVARFQGMNRLVVRLPRWQEAEGWSCGLQQFDSPACTHDDVVEVPRADEADCASRWYELREGR